MRGEHDQQAAQAARRADRRLGADSAPVRLARAARIRAHPPPGAVRRPGRRARGGDRGVLGSHAAAEGRPLRGGGHGEPLRLRDGQAQETAARREAAHRGPQGRASRLQPERDLARLLRALWAPSAPQDGQARPHRGARPAAVCAPLPALPREPRAQGRQGGRGSVARGRVEREGYLRVGTSTVYRILRRWAEEGPEGLEDRPHGRPPGVRKVTLRAMEAIRRFQQNPNLGEVRIHAALAQIGIHLSPRTCLRILALNREIYGLDKPKGPVKEKKEMPFAARRRHQYWSADVRYVDNDRVGGRAYTISVLDNHSRAVLASALTRTQDLASYLSVLYAAVERYGSPEALVTDGGIFRATQARAVYEALGIAKHEIERGRPWQNYIETHFNVQCRMADWYFARAESWTGLAAAHERFVEDYNAQAHFAHAGRADGRRSPAEVLECASARRSSGAPSSPHASCGCWTPWATRALGTGGCTVRRRWRAGRPPCGSP